MKGKIVSGMMLTILLLTTLTLIVDIQYAKAEVSEANYEEGIDVSDYQGGNINWTKVYEKGNKQFAFVKATEGNLTKDDELYFTRNMENGRKAGLDMGAYHLARPEYYINDTITDAVSEAIHFVNVTTREHGKNYLNYGLPPALDIEPPYGDKLGKDKKLSQWVLAWIKTFESETKKQLGTEIKPVIYTSVGYAKDYLNKSVTSYKLWIADYDKSPPRTGIWGKNKKSWDYWQYSETGEVPGITDPSTHKPKVDLDRRPRKQARWSIITSPDVQMSALTTHSVAINLRANSSAGPVPRPTDISNLVNHGFTITSMPRIGFMFMLPNNRVWPFGVLNADTTHPNYWRAKAMRKGIHRLINVNEIVDQVFTDPLTGLSTMSKAERWLPPGMESWTATGQEPWIPDITVPPFDPLGAAELLDAAGFVQHTPGLCSVDDPGDPNPFFDPDYPGSAEYWRVDPLKQCGTRLHFTYYALTATISPLGFEMATKISNWFKIAGIDNTLDDITWLEMVWKLTNPIIDDYQLMSGIAVFWGTTAPDILFDFTFSENLPLWNLVAMNFSEADFWGIEMMSTLNVTRMLEATIKIQEVLRDHEPYLPMLIDNGFAAFVGETDPLNSSWQGPGYLGIVNQAGSGALGYSSNIGLLSPRGQVWSSNVWAKRKAQIDWILPYNLDSLNPLTANTEPDWQVLGLVTDVLLQIDPYTRNYIPQAAESMPISELWIGPGGSKRVGGNGVYDAPFNGTHYNDIPVANVAPADLVGDDQLGMVTTWMLRDGMYWHDSDPGLDRIFGTLDDGVVYPVTTADVEFAAKLLMGKTAAAAYENVRYFGIWQHLAGYVEPHEGPFAVEIVNETTFRIYEERRYPFAFESHSDMALLTPKHIWEPFVNSGGDPLAWMGWDEPYMEDPTQPGNWLTKLNGLGPFRYHFGGLGSSVSVNLEGNELYFGDTPCPADVDLEIYFDPMLPEGFHYFGIVDLHDYGIIVDAIYVYDPRADFADPQGKVGLEEISIWALHLGCMWFPG